MATESPPLRQSGQPLLLLLGVLRQEGWRLDVMSYGWQRGVFTLQLAP